MTGAVERFARVDWHGVPRWISVPDAGRPELLAGTPLEPVDRERQLSEAEVQGLRYLPPCPSSKVLGLGYNYKGLVGPRDEYQEPVFFLKSPTSLCGHGSTITLPSFATNVWVEGEVGIVVGRRCH